MREQSDIQHMGELELAMREVQAGLADFVLEFAFNPESIGFRSIELNPVCAEVIPFPRKCQVA